MGMWVGRGRKARVAYGFDDIALVPGALTVNPNEVDISWELCGHRYELPIIAAAMDGVVGPKLARYRCGGSHPRPPSGERADVVELLRRNPRHFAQERGDDSVPIPGVQQRLQSIDHAGWSDGHAGGDRRLVVHEAA